MAEVVGALEAERLETGEVGAAVTAAAERGGVDRDEIGGTEEPEDIRTKLRRIEAEGAWTTRGTIIYLVSFLIGTWVICFAVTHLLIEALFRISD